MIKKEWLKKELSFLNYLKTNRSGRYALYFMVICIVILGCSIYAIYPREMVFEEKISYIQKPLPSLEDTDLYTYYKNLDRPPTSDYSLYVLNPYDDIHLFNSFLNFSFDEIVSFCCNISYEYEGDMVEYPRYPIETLVDGCGDCEDTSILLASILYLKGFDVSLVRFDNHMMVWVADIGLIETTSSDLDYDLDYAVDVYPVVSHPILVIDWSASVYIHDDCYFSYFDISVFNFGDVGSNATLVVSDNVSCYYYSILVDAFSVCYIDLDIGIKSKDVDCEIKDLSKNVT